MQQFLKLFFQSQQKYPEALQRSQKLAVNGVSISKSIIFQFLRILLCNNSSYANLPKAVVLKYFYFEKYDRIIFFTENHARNHTNTQIFRT